MQDKLKQFVDEHRAAFDMVEAPQVFAGLQLALPAKSALKFFTKYSKMIKIGFFMDVVNSLSMDIFHKKTLTQWLVQPLASFELFSDWAITILSRSLR